MILLTTKSQNFEKLLLLLFIVFNLHAYKIDENTFLMWQDVPENKGTLHTWLAAKEYCEELDYSGFDDWWLPSEQELISIVDLSRPKNRKIQKGFIYFKPRYYWTSSTYAWNAPHAWVISFKTGSSSTVKKEDLLHVRCVRCSDFKLCLEKFYE